MADVYISVCNKQRQHIVLACERDTTKCDIVISWSFQMADVDNDGDAALQSAVVDMTRKTSLVSRRGQWIEWVAGLRLGVWI